MHLFRLVSAVLFLAVVQNADALQCFSCWKLDCRDSNMDQCAFMRNVTLEHENVTTLTETLPQRLPACPTSDHDLRWNEKFYENCTESSQACVTVVINLASKITREYIHVTPYDILAPPKYFHASIIIMGCAKGSWKEYWTGKVSSSTSPTRLQPKGSGTKKPLVTHTPAVTLTPEGSEGPGHQKHSTPKHHKGPRQRGHAGKKHPKSGQHVNTTTAAPTENSHSSTAVMNVSTTIAHTVVSTTTIKPTTTTSATDKGGAFAFLNPLFNLFKHQQASNSSVAGEQPRENTTTTLPVTHTQVKNVSVTPHEVGAAPKSRRRRNTGGIGSDAGTIMGSGGQPPVFSSETGVAKLPVHENATAMIGSTNVEVASSASSKKPTAQVTTSRSMTNKSTTSGLKTPVTVTTTLLPETKTSRAPSTTSRVPEHSATTKGPVKTTLVKHTTSATTALPQPKALNETNSNGTAWLGYLNPFLDVLFGVGDFNDQIVVEDEVPQCPTSFEYKQNRTEVSGKRVAVLHLVANFSYCEKCSGNLCNVHIPYEKEKVLYPWYDQMNEIEESTTTQPKKTHSHTTSRPSGESCLHFTSWVLVATVVAAMLSPNF